MPPRKPDRRTERSRTALMSAFVGIVLSEGYEAVTVERVAGVFFDWPVRPIWVKCLAEMIEPRLAAVSRHARGRPILPLPLIALQIAEAQIALVTHWLRGRVPAQPEAVAEALVAETRAMLVCLLRVKPEASLFIPGEKLHYVQA